ncbi:hypothetical protein HD554DRAFT_1243373 [Boletus coccyginus]|nr:hypothetical protein HD554DRAFT_1243373 [Boletus coccyginus]
MESVPPKFLEQLFIRKSFAFAGYTFLIYDYFLTLSLEVAYIWDDPWTVVKILFLISRYGNLIGQTFIVLEETGHLSHGSQKFCTGFQLFVPFFVILTGELIRLLVVLRVCAILDCRRRVTVMLNLLYVIYAVGILAATLYMFNQALPLDFPFVNETGICWTPVPPDMWHTLFIPLGLDSFMLAALFLSLYRTTKGSRGTVRPSPLIRPLVRNAVLFYIATLLNSLLCMASWTALNTDPRDILQLFVSTPFLNVMGQRLVLNLREPRVQPDVTCDIREVAMEKDAKLSSDVSWESGQGKGQRAV